MMHVLAAGAVGDCAVLGWRNTGQRCAVFTTGHGPVVRRGWRLVMLSQLSGLGMVALARAPPAASSDSPSSSTRPRIPLNTTSLPSRLRRRRLLIRLHHST
jgi:hypothetical protein